MSVNKYKPHVWVIPEDDANRQLVNGFLQHHSVDLRTVGINPPAGGWGVAINVFENDFVQYLRNWPLAYVVIVIDFDGTTDRRSQCEMRIPEDLRQRVFLVGSRETPEILSKELKMRLERIGEGLANDCLKDNCELWEHPHLSHNHDELLRMIDLIKPIVFPKD